MIFKDLLYFQKLKKLIKIIRTKIYAIDFLIFGYLSMLLIYCR